MGAKRSSHSALPCFRAPQETPHPVAIARSLISYAIQLLTLIVLSILMRRPKSSLHVVLRSFAALRVMKK